MASIDLSKLTPETWVEGVSGNCNVVYFDGDDIRGVAAIRRPVDREFVLLARRAFGVMMRRGWWAEPIPESGQWLCWCAFGVIERYGAFGRFSIIPTEEAPVDIKDPFTALVEADEWMTEQEGKAHE